MTSLLRHTLAALAYRAHAPSRTPAEIPAHMGDLFDWALSAAVGEERWQVSQPRAWAEEQQRFFSSLRSLDSFWPRTGRCTLPSSSCFKAR